MDRGQRHHSCRRWGNLPLVIRKDGDFYLFVGACLLIDSELADEPDIQTDPGFSDIMRGSVCKDIGKSSRLDEFLIY